MQLAVILQTIFTVGTLTALMLVNGWPSNYEELCIMIGGSFLWFITLPCAVVAYLEARRWKKQNEEKSRAWEEQ